MTDEQIIEMANKAFDESSFTDAEVIRFAKLVAQHEREACAKVCSTMNHESAGEKVSASWIEAEIRARGEA